jgi:hypothetical protein
MDAKNRKLFCDSLISAGVADAGYSTHLPTRNRAVHAKAL